MNKSNEKLNLLRDIRVYDYVANEQKNVANEHVEAAEAQSDGAYEQFKAALNADSELQHEIEVERELRSAIKQTQPASPIQENNIDSLFDRIDAQEQINADEASNNNVSTTAESNIVQFTQKKSVVGFGIAASLFLAVFLSTNFTTDSSLEPQFTTLTNQGQVPNDRIDFNSLVSQDRVVRLEFSTSASVEDINSLMSKYQLQQLNQQYRNNNTVTAYSDKSFDTAKLSKLKSERLIEVTELFKF